MTGVIAALAGGGGTFARNTVTVGQTYISPARFNYGFQGSNGSVSPTTWSISGTSIVNAIYVTFDGSNWVDFRISGSYPNSGWTNLDIAGTNWARTDASYSTDGSQTYWIWFSPPSNPFGTTIGATKVMTWT